MPTRLEFVPEQQLRWFVLYGSYASALVAASTPERAIEVISKSDHAWLDSGRGWIVGEEDPATPAPPPAEGVYHTHGE